MRILRIVVLAAAVIACCPECFSWGQKGHDVTCAIAERHLTPRAKRKISEILDGKSIVYWSKYMDEVRGIPELEYTKTWHYKNIDADEAYDTAALHPDGDVVTALNLEIGRLAGGELSKEEEALALKMIIHFMGDLHCPMHMAHKSDIGGNKWQVRYFGQGKNLHGVWDSSLVESARKWSYTEWAEQLDRCPRKEIRRIVQGNPYEWGRETFAITEKVYADSPVGANLSYDYVSKWTPVVEQQFLYAGLRLASVLNDIF